MSIILGTIQRAVMDTAHLVGQGGVSFSTDLEGTLEMPVLTSTDGHSDHLTQKRQLLPDLNGTKCVKQIAVGRVHHQININILCSPGNAHVPFSVKLATKVALDSMPTVEQTPLANYLNFTVHLQYPILQS
ncbi:hypothetical protein T07_10004 [Trichinella nelsoni]|uniref:Uncharacterized protein n=1 Tax=Trichinella nelsoni TaxID=6336 RepID=A0A0V0RMT8_9BILA|nr:hypothetical protein T07_10004 [Trichinella nelsoni]